MREFGYMRLTNDAKNLCWDFEYRLEGVGWIAGVGSQTEGGFAEGSPNGTDWGGEAGGIQAGATLFPFSVNVQYSNDLKGNSITTFGGGFSTTGVSGVLFKSKTEFIGPCH